MSLINLTQIFSEFKDVLSDFLKKFAKDHIILFCCGVIIFTSFILYSIYILFIKLLKYKKSNEEINLDLPKNNNKNVQLQNNNENVQLQNVQLQNTNNIKNTSIKEQSNELVNKSLEEEKEEINTIFIKLEKKYEKVESIIESLYAFFEARIMPVYNRIENSFITQKDWPILIEHSSHLSQCYELLYSLSNDLYGSIAMYNAKVNEKFMPRINEIEIGLNDMGKKFPGLSKLTNTYIIKYISKINKFNKNYGKTHIILNNKLFIELMNSKESLQQNYNTFNHEKITEHKLIEFDNNIQINESIEDIKPIENSITCEIKKTINEGNNELDFFNNNFNLF